MSWVTHSFAHFLVFWGSTWHLCQGVVSKLIAWSQMVFPFGNTCLGGLSLSSHVWDTPKWGMSRGSNIFCESHTQVSIQAWPTPHKMTSCQISLGRKSDKISLLTSRHLRGIAGLLASLLSKWYMTGGTGLHGISSKIWFLTRLL